MALRVGGAKPIEKEEVPVQEETPAVEEPMPEDLMAELPESLEEEPLPEEAGGEVDPMVAGYRGPEEGPFTCGNCVFFARHGANTCAIVAGPIDEGGLCNMFTTAGVPDQEEPAPLPEEAPPTEIPPQEPMPEGEPYPEE